MFFRFPSGTVDASIGSIAANSGGADAESHWQQPNGDGDAGVALASCLATQPNQHPL